MSTRAEYLNSIINAQGCQCRNPESLVDVAGCARLSWVSDNCFDVMGRAAPPDQCPVCFGPGPWQLDHMNPWRQYIVACGGPHLQVGGHHNTYWMAKKYVRALYNDPENLWWLCAACNREKTDYVYDTADQLLSLQRQSIPVGAKMRGPANLWKIV